MGDNREQREEKSSPFAKLEYEEWTRHSHPSAYDSVLDQREARVALALILVGLTLLFLYVALFLAAR
ncbi:hypothetical protein IG193_02680 [Infirmifilum lucidum]|uniref:Uncharacterized protein n=1 Tax=Infirmifilum lucidum TaxID=2776706 RepID=A0A7L9FKP7_9CREN|nr:hypothetical protein [Infirmifilum lucidum]QOJ79385.1 hypothetical protein IG193_02680 [Infirmifilum lucidum]